MDRITDPAKSLERVFERIHECEENLASAPEILRPSYERRLRALRGTRTRLINLLASTPA